MTSEETVAKGYSIKTGSFEGPLDVLLEFIEKRKLHINEVSLVEVTNDYIAYMRGLPTVDLDEATAFILIASTLVLIKSRSLLPGLALTKDEEEQIVDLEKRLRLYEVVKNASATIKENFGKRILALPGTETWPETVFAPDPRLTTALLHVAAQSVIHNIPKKEFLPEVTVRKVLSLEEMMGSLAERIESGMALSFNQLSKHPNPGDPKEQKVYVIVSFLAMLELVRSGIIDVLQSEHFADMEIKKQELGENYA